MASVRSEHTFRLNDEEVRFLTEVVGKYSPAAVRELGYDPDETLEPVYSALTSAHPDYVSMN